MPLFRTTDIDTQLSELRNDLISARDTLTVDESVALTGRLQLMLASVEDYRLKIKWALGFVLARTAMAHGTRRATIDEISQRLWTEHRIRAGKSHLYECVKLYDTFEGDYQQFLEWVENKKRFMNRPVYWIDVQDDCFGGRSNPDVIGEDEAAERDLFKAEKGAEALERLLIRAQEGDEEAVGAVEGIRQHIEGVNGSSVRAVIPRSREYLRFVRAFTCLVCRSPAEAHHAIGHGGTGVKPSDFGAVPLCRRHHRTFHRLGLTEFERRNGVHLMEVAFNLLHKYITDEWASMRLEEPDSP